MNRIDAVFSKRREQGRAALIVFITAGDPDLETTAELVPELAAAGADIIELGVPHSDPIAEGPTIQASSQRSLAHQTKPLEILELCRQLRESSEVPLVLMGYVLGSVVGSRLKLVDVPAFEPRAATLTLPPTTTFPPITVPSSQMRSPPMTRSQLINSRRTVRLPLMRPLTLLR